MCFGNSSVLLEWLNELIVIYSKIYNDPYIDTIEDRSEFCKYIISIEHGYSSNHIIAWQAKKNDLPMLTFNEGEIKEFKEFLLKIKKIHSIFIEKTGRHICVNPNFFIHHCFPEKNIIPYYYKPPSKEKQKIYEETWSIINSLIN